MTSELPPNTKDEIAGDLEKHRIEINAVVGTARDWSASCYCGWRGYARPTTNGAWRDGELHQAESLLPFVIRKQAEAWSEGVIAKSDSSSIFDRDVLDANPYGSST